MLEYEDDFDLFGTGDGPRPPAQAPTGNVNIGTPPPYKPGYEAIFQNGQWVQYPIDSSGRHTDRDPEIDAIGDIHRATLAKRPGSGGGGGGGGGGYGGRGGSYGGGGNFGWPQYNAPRYSPGAAFQAPPAFAFEGFKAPTADSIYSDPSYKMRRDEGLQAIEHGAAAKGLTRLPATLKSLGSWNQDFASREYGNIFDRGAQAWGMNRNNAADAYSLNYGVSRDVWDRGEQQNLSAFDRNSKASFDEFDFNSWRPASATFEDLYRRDRDILDANTRIATGNND